MKTEIQAIDCWNSLRHSGLLMDRKRLHGLFVNHPNRITEKKVDSLREAVELAERSDQSELKLTTYFLEDFCGLNQNWTKANHVEKQWSRANREGIHLKPDRIWQDNNGAVLPVFIEKDSRALGIGKGRRLVSRVVQWLRCGNEKLALLTNCRQWRLIYAGPDFEAWCESDSDCWFEDGTASNQLIGLASLLNPEIWIPQSEGQKSPLLSAIEESRKGQADLSATLGERVRKAVEILIDAHQAALDKANCDIPSADLYRGAVRIIMRLVVVLFAEARGLLPVDNTIYHSSYGLRALLESLKRRRHAVGQSGSKAAWPRLLALFRLVESGSGHPNLPVRAYGGELFQKGDISSPEGLSRALWLFESACFENESFAVSDKDVLQIIEQLCVTKEKIPGTPGLTNVPVDFSDLSSEYIGILYEGLLDYELKIVPSNDPVIILPVGTELALPLSRLQAMQDDKIAELMSKLAKEGKVKKTSDDSEGEEGFEEDPDSVEHENDSGPNDLDAESLDEANLQDDFDSEPVDRHPEEIGEQVFSMLRRLVVSGKLVPKLRGKSTPEKIEAHYKAVETKTRSLLGGVRMPGRRYLVRWGGTRKGSGTFYTKPGLSGPLIQRTLVPLAYIPPTQTNGCENKDAPLSDWVPRKPEEILALKVCDISCGSGTFPVGALRFLSQALWDSVHFYKRITPSGDNRTAVSFYGKSNSDQSISEEYLPCLPEDEAFEFRLRAQIKRHVAERCIYGVDLDPLASELCRLAIWIETLDPDLPFSFLDHKIKCGNSLIGSWYDQFPHYPAMAWKHREGGDKSHSNGIHFKKGIRGKAFEFFVADNLTSDLRKFLKGPDLYSESLLNKTDSVHKEAMIAISRLHNMPVHGSAERAQIYREKFLGSPTQQALKKAMDLWCACWFWPGDGLENAPLPSTFSEPNPETLAAVERIAAQQRFFHWELEFPDVFQNQDSGFDAIIGNPPWDIAKPNSKEFFSNIDPLYRGLGNPETRQTELFEDIKVEREWLDYNERFVAWSNFVKFASNPCGDPEHASTVTDAFPIARGRENQKFHADWREARARSQGFCDPNHPFRNQGGSDLNLYKLFAEQMVRLLRKGGLIGLISPAAIYSDKESEPLRQLLIEGCSLQWLFGFENRTKIFPIDSRFRFCCLIARRGSQTKSIRMAFGRRELSEWADAERIVINVAGDDLHLFSPTSKAVPEIDNNHDLGILRTIFANGIILGRPEAEKWGHKYVREYDMTAARKKGEYTISEDVLRGGNELAPGFWRHQQADYVPLYTGKMMAQFDFCFQGWLSGHGKQSKWEQLDFQSKLWRPEFVSPLSRVRHQWKGGTRLVFRDITIATNERTALAAVIPAWPCGNKLPILAEEGQVSIQRQLALCCILNSFVYDFVVRNRMTGINLNKFILDETPVPNLDSIPLELSVVGARLCLVHEVFASAWYELLESCPDLGERPWKAHWATYPIDRLELRAISDAIVAHLYGLNESQFRWILRNCDYSKDQLALLNFRAKLPSKGFWRTGIGSAEHAWRQAWNCDPELRLPNLAIVAYVELDRLKRNGGGNLSAAIKSFSPINGSGGWRLPEGLRLLDYGLGQDLRAKKIQALRSLFGSGEGHNNLSKSSWDDCRQLADDMRKLWAENTLRKTGSLVTENRKGQGGRRSSAIGQGRLFEADQ